MQIGKRMTREQKRRAQRFNATVSAIGFIAFVLFVGILLGSAVAAATPAESTEPPQNAPVIATAIHAPEAAELAVDPPSNLMEEPAEDVWTEEVYPLTYLGEFTISHYCACIACCGKDDGITATGTQATEGRTIAVDPTVIPYGTEIIIYYDDGRMGTYTAEDCGGAIKGNRLDVYMESHEAALIAGMTTGSVYMGVS